MNKYGSFGASSYEGGARIDFQFQCGRLSYSGAINFADSPKKDEKPINYTIYVELDNNGEQRCYKGQIPYIEHIAIDHE